MTTSFLWRISWSVLAGALATFLLLTRPVWAADAGDLVKCPDYSAVYYLAEDGNRYAFPNENIYFSWYEDFDDVQEISCEELADLSLSDVVQYQAGTDLVKIMSNPTVYFVEPDGVLRAIEDEEQAEALFGEDWASLVDDLNDAFFPQYELGEPIEDGEIPVGMYFSDEEGNLYRMSEEGVAAEIDDMLEEGRKKMLEGFAQATDDFETRFEEAFAAMGADFATAGFDFTVLEGLMLEMMETMKTVMVEGLGGMFADIFADFEGEGLPEVVENPSLEDANGDGLLDWWQANAEWWTEEEEFTDEDGDGLDDWWQDNYETWYEDGYWEYTNFYADEWGGEWSEDSYEDWWSEYDEVWDDYDWGEWQDEYEEHTEDYQDVYYDTGEWDWGAWEDWSDYEDDWSEWVDVEDGGNWEDWSSGEWSEMTGEEGMEDWSWAEGQDVEGWVEGEGWEEDWAGSEDWADYQDDYQGIESFNSDEEEGYSGGSEAGSTSGGYDSGSSGYTGGESGGYTSGESGGYSGGYSY